MVTVKQSFQETLQGTEQKFSELTKLELMVSSYLGVIKKIKIWSIYIHKMRECIDELSRGFDIEI